MSKIEWTGKTWNPMVGCSKISAGCQNCYAIKDAHRLAGNPNPKISSVYAGLTERRAGRTEWTGEVNFVADRLELPLKTRKPTTWFVNSMSDLFHEAVTDGQLDQIFAVMALTPQHTYQVLTKRPERMLEYTDGLTSYKGGMRFAAVIARSSWIVLEDRIHAVKHRLIESLKGDGGSCLPLQNVWLGVTVENQKAADERIPLLLQTPAAVRFLSCEPLLQEVDLTYAFALIDQNGEPYAPRCKKGGANMIDWVIVGGESGPGARHCKLDWIRSIVAQCAESDVPCFVKQLGSDPAASRAEDVAIIHNSTGKGGNPDEWPEALRVRQMPNVPIPA